MIIAPRPPGTSRRVAGSFRDPSGYVFRRGERVFRAIDGRCHQVLDDLARDGTLDRLVSEFGEYNARELELRSTTVFVHRHAEIPNGEAGRRKLVQLVKEIKPRFSNEEIQETVGELEGKAYISFG